VLAEVMRVCRLLMSMDDISIFILYFMSTHTPTIFGVIRDGYIILPASFHALRDGYMDMM
jgi:hypothetical protein